MKITVTGPQAKTSQRLYARDGKTHVERVLRLTAKGKRAR